jgi:hypothetical protein
LENSLVYAKQLHDKLHQDVICYLIYSFKGCTLDKLLEMGLPLHHFLIFAPFNYLPVLQQKNDIRVFDGLNPMRNVHCCNSLQLFIDVLLDVFLGLLVKGGSAFVHEEYSWLSQDGPCAGDALLLPA